MIDALGLLLVGFLSSLEALLLAFIAPFISLWNSMI
jgi:hypothetical protein